MSILCHRGLSSVFYLYKIQLKNLMAEAKSFEKRKLIIGVIAGKKGFFRAAEGELRHLFGPIDLKSRVFEFDFTDYYSKQMGNASLNRKFLSFKELINPEKLSEIKLTTNRLEEKLKKRFSSSHRIVNIDPGIMDSSSLIMATVKDFAHRIPLSRGIYGHLELLFGKDEIKTLDWTYPDFREKNYHLFLLRARKKYLDQIK